MNIAVDSNVEGRMPKADEMEHVVVDAPSLTPDQISELAQPISPDTSTQSSTLKAILQQLILINERLEKWEQTYVAYQEMQRIWRRPVYKKKEDEK